MTHASANPGGDTSPAELLERTVKELLDETAAERAAARAQAARLQAELEQARAAVAELTRTVEQLRQEKSELEGERDQYLRSLHALLPRPEVDFTEAELDELRQHGVTFDQIQRDLLELGGA
jgi:chromosome segregation ATPase